MNYKTILCAAILTPVLSSQGFACEKHMHSKKQEANMSATPVMKPKDEMSGEVCFPYRYTSEQNKTQTLGMLRASGESAPASTPKHMSEDLTQETKVVKPKKRKVSKPKPVAKTQDAYQEPIKAAPEANVDSQPVKPVAPEQPKETPAAPVTPEAPKAKETDAGTVTTPSQTPAVVTPTPTQPATPVTPAPTELEKSAAPQSQSSQMNLTPQPTPSINQLASRVANIEYAGSEVDMSAMNMGLLSSIVADLKNSQSLKAKIHSYAYSDSGNMSDARRISLQRAIKIRKHLIDNDISASRISVNAIEDSNNKMNKVEIQLAETN